MDLIISQLRDAEDSWKNKVESLESQNAVLQKEVSSLKTQYHNKSTELEQLKTDLKTQQDIVQAQNTKIFQLEQERSDFLKVSHVISLEKMNYKLQVDLNNALEKLKTFASTPDSSVDNLNIFEKKIKGVWYYINADDNETVYKKEDDESVGPVVGTLIDGKRLKLI